MDCSICSSVRPPRNSICQACYDGAKGMIDFLNKLEHNREIIDKPSCSYLPKSNSSKFQGISDAFKWVKDMNEKLSFLNGSVTMFKDGIHGDIKVMPGKGSSIFAHRVVLAARSGIFKNMLETDGCKAPPNETISLPELNHEELESLLEFLYSGSLPIDKLDKNKYSLLVAAHKYEIPFLQKICENRILESIDSSNVHDVLKILNVCSNTKLKDAAMDIITEHIKNMDLSSRVITTPLPKKKKHHSRGRSKNSDRKGKSRDSSSSRSNRSKSRSSRSSSSSRSSDKSRDKNRGRSGGGSKNRDKSRGGKGKSRIRGRK